MIRRPPRSTRTDTLFPYTTLFRSLGLIRPELWLVAPGWIWVILACLILDTVAGANPRHLTLDARFPHQVGVGDAFELSLTARGRSLPQRAELALALDERLAARSEERRVGREGVRTCRTRWAPDH